MKYKAAAIQMQVANTGDKKVDKPANLKKALGLMEAAAADGAKVACFPDYFLTDTPNRDMTRQDLVDVAEPIPDGPTIDTFSKVCKRLGIYLVAGSMVEMGEDKKLYSTCAFIGPDGKLIGKVRKMHPENAPAKYEIGCGITPGPGEFPIFETELGKIGIMIDMDGIAVEVPRILGLKGADVIFWPINFSVRFTDGIHLANRFNSIAARYAYLVASSRIGWKKNTPLHDWAFMGESRADLMYAGATGIVFAGSYIAMVNDFSEGIAVGPIDSDKPAVVRRLRFQEMPLERRPELYELISKL
jgi:predicted amidohydrolase